jgi:hypothetical protein
MAILGHRSAIPERQGWVAVFCATAAFLLLVVLPARAQQPDLVPSIESGTSIVSLAGPGSGLQAVITVQNVGSGATQIAFWVRLYVGWGRGGCTNDEGTVDEVLVAMTLPPGGEVTGLTMQGALPGGISPGAYYLCAVADSRGFVAESDETNNETNAPLQVVECLADADCDDFVSCTVETCSNQVCTSAPVVCDDGSLCTVDQCSMTTGLCVFTPVSCNDGDACTVDRCDPGLGCVGDPVDCDDEDPCTADSCHSSLGCVHTAIECPAPVPVGDSTGWLLLVGLVAGLGAFGAHRLAGSAGSA